MNGGDFLRTMAASSATRVAAARARESEAALRERALAAPPAPALSFDPSGFDLIAEFKRHAPSLDPRSVAVVPDRPGAPELAGPRAAAARARLYVAGGAAAVSVLTEPDRFGGELADLQAVAAAVAVPAMRKDFLVEPYQVYEARAAGAGGVLLILRILDDAQLGAMLDAAAECGLFALVEAFDRRDLERAKALRGATGSGSGGTTISPVPISSARDAPGCPINSAKLAIASPLVSLLEITIVPPPRPPPRRRPPSGEISGNPGRGHLLQLADMHAADPTAPGGGTGRRKSRGPVLPRTRG